MREWEHKWLQVWRVRTGKKKEKGVALEVGRWEGREEVAELGREGWELVSVQPFTTTFGGETWAGGPGAS